MSTTPENLVNITSTSQFQELLSKDLNRVSLLNFWVPWAEQCTTMNQIVLELAKKYPTLLVLQVEAEARSDIAESFDIEAVPTFIILRGHTLLDRINGADAQALTGALAKHVGAHNAEDALQSRLKALVNQSQVVLFMKGNPDTPRCGFSRTMVGLLRDQKIDFTHFDILTDDSVRQGLKKMNNWPTYPQLIINGELVGGLDITKEMIDNGELKELLA